MRSALTTTAVAALVLIAGCTPSRATGSRDNTSPAAVPATTTPAAVPATTTPAAVPAMTTPAAASASTPVGTPTTASSAASPPVPPTLTTAGTAAAAWNSPELVITGHSLGAVTIGMTLTQAARAAGVGGFAQIGDGVSVPAPWSTQLDRPDLYLSFASFVFGQERSDFSCVGAVIAAKPARSTQVVVTTEGVRLGDPASRVTQVYGLRATFVPEPTTGGIEPAAGYVVAEEGFDLVFKVDPQRTRIVAIFGGVAPTTPSNCPS